jgi:hypothetical protein
MIIVGAIAGVALLVWIGTRIFPGEFASYPEESQPPEMQSLPPDLPGSVRRFYQVLYGPEIPRFHSFILSGRGKLRFNGLTFPARLRFTHQAGKGYRHYIETTFWGLPLLKVNEHYLNWQSRLALPFGVIENEPQVDQAANLGLWSETLMFPAVFLTAAGVRWEAVDETTARLIVPFMDGEDQFTVHFNPDTGLVNLMEAMRWKNAGDAQKTRWQAQALEWGTVDGWTMPVLFAAQWMDEETPWLTARIEDVNWNVDVSSYIEDVGP